TNILHTPMYNDVWRTFQFDYVYVDCFFLICWLTLLIRIREYRALAFGAILAPLIYGVDAGIWWNSRLNDPRAGSFVREYWIDGRYVPHGAASLIAAKFMCDFMMTISFALFAFPWLWVAFRSIVVRQYRRA